MDTDPTPRRYILLPPRGTTLGSAQANVHLGPFFKGMTAGPVPGVLPLPEEVKLIDSTHESGLKLVEATVQGVMDLKAQQPGLRIVPEVFYDTATATAMPRLAQAATTATGGVPTMSTMQVVRTGTLAPVAGARVVAFTDFIRRTGDQGVTDANGKVALAVGAQTRLDRLYVYPANGYWPVMQLQVQLPFGGRVQVEPIKLNEPDALQYFMRGLPGSDGSGVKVAVIDTGSGPHVDLLVSGGMNTVLGELPTDFADNGDHHGTHVAGIIAAMGIAPAGMRGIAPEVTLLAYRVFPAGGRASNYSIAKAIDAAVAAGCDLINMSLGVLGASDAATSASIEDARAAGVVVVCASGNDGVNEICQPGADPQAVAVGCFGRHGLFPPGSVSSSNVGAPLGADPQNFMASFSNHGVDIDFAGPGVGVVSTVPGNAWAVMDGTSMACPAVTGMIARLLSAKPQVLAMPRNQARSDEILRMAHKAAAVLGFGPQYEGNGWIG
jgi:subtilisin family serine protease